MMHLLFRSVGRLRVITGASILNSGFDNVCQRLGQAIDSSPTPCEAAAAILQDFLQAGPPSVDLPRFHPKQKEVASELQRLQKIMQTLWPRIGECVHAMSVFTETEFLVFPTAALRERLQDVLLLECKLLASTFSSIPIVDPKLVFKEMPPARAQPVPPPSRPTASPGPGPSPGGGTPSADQSPPLRCQLPAPSPPLSPLSALSVLYVEIAYHGDADKICLLPAAQDIFRDLILTTLKYSWASSRVAATMRQLPGPGGLEICVRNRTCPLRLAPGDLDQIAACGTRAVACDRRTLDAGYELTRAFCFARAHKGRLFAVLKGEELCGFRCVIERS